MIYQVPKIKTMEEGDQALEDIKKLATSYFEQMKIERDTIKYKELTDATYECKKARQDIQGQMQKLALARIAERKQNG